MTYHIYTDGSCRQSGCGFGVVGLFNKKMLFAHQEQCQNSTNNREELKAIIAAIKAAQRDPANEYIIYSDSSYCVKSINEWMPQWYQKNWINSKKKEVENIDLMKTLFSLLYATEENTVFPIQTNFSIQWLKGHNNIIGNELADALATKNTKKFKQIITENQIEINKVDIF